MNIACYNKRWRILTKKKTKKDHQGYKIFIDQGGENTHLIFLKATHQ